MVGVLEQLRAAPGVAEVILRPGADGGRELLSVHEELLIALAPPSAARVPDVQHDTDKPSGALGLDDGPVNPSLLLLRQEGIPMPLGVKARQPLRRPGKGRGADLEDHGAGRFAVVGQLQLGLLAEWHVPVAIPPAVARVAQRQRAVVAAARNAEEISERRPDRRLLFAVPPDLEGQLPERIAVGGGCR